MATKKQTNTESRPMSTVENCSFVGVQYDAKAVQAISDIARKAIAERPAPPAPAVPDEVAKDAARFRWLLEDHADPETRAVVKTLLVSMRTRSLSGARLDIDAAMLADAKEVKP